MVTTPSLEHLLVADHPCVLIVTHEEDRALKQVRRAAGSVRSDLLAWSVTTGIRSDLDMEACAISDTEDPVKALHFLKRTEEEDMVCVMTDLIGHLENEATIRLLREVIRHFSRKEDTLVLIDYRDDLPEVIASHATRYEIPLPDEEELSRVVKETVREYHKKVPLEAKLTRRDLRTIVKNLKGLTLRQARRIIIECIVEDWRLDARDINTVLARKRQVLHSGGLLQYVETPVDMGEIGGLNNLKRWLEAREKALGREAEDYGLEAPRGVLLLGVQGAGKSLCTKAIATAWQRPLLRLDPGSLYDKFIGESERRLRRALAQAEAMSPIVLWIDEIEKGFASAAGRNTDGGVSRRIFGELLTWMQEHTSPVFVAATANDIESLPPELLRKGRFDEIFFVDLPDADARKEIFSIHLEKRDRDPARFDLDELAEASRGFSGAEIEQAVTSALHRAFAEDEDLGTEHMLEQLKNSPPLSVTMAEKVQQLRQWAQDRCVPAN